MKINNLKLQTPNFKSYALTNIANHTVNMAVYNTSNIDRFVTANNKILLEKAKRITPFVVLDLFLTQNMNIGNNEVNDMPNFREFIFKILDKVKFPSKFIVHDKTAISPNLSNAILTKESINRIPDNCKMNSRYYTLFPNYKRFFISQGDFGDCYLLATLDSLIKTRSGYEFLASMFYSQSDSPLYVEIRRDVNENNDSRITKEVESLTTKVPVLQKWRLNNMYGGAVSPPWAKYFEVAFAKITNHKLNDLYKKYNYRIRITPSNNISDKYITTGQGGYSCIVYELLGCTNIENKLVIPQKLLDSIKDINNNEDIIKKIIEKSKAINDINKKFCTVSTNSVNTSSQEDNFYSGLEAYDYAIIPSHVYALSAYNKDKDEFIINNPHYSGVDIKIDWNSITEKFDGFVSADLPSCDIWENPYDPDDYVYDPDDFNKVWMWYS